MATAHNLARAHNLAEAHNLRIFQSLMARGHLPILPAAFLQQAPRRVAEPTWDRVRGMLLGLAVGDALGAPCESRSPADRRRRYGEVRDYLDGSGRVSDDSQLAFRTVAQLLEHGQVRPRQLAAGLGARPIRGAGDTLREFLARYQRGLPWYECAPRSAGNGALMRIAPVLLPHLQDPSPALWVDTLLAAAVTHLDAASLASCAAFIHLLRELLACSSPPHPDWYLAEFLRVADELEPPGDYRPRTGDGYRGRLCDYVAEQFRRARREGLTSLQACERFRSGAYLLETVPCLLYLLACHGHDPEQAVVRAVNDTWDSDTLGSLVGAAVGALHGVEALPPRWLANLDPDLDGGPGIFELLDSARSRFASSLPESQPGMSSRRSHREFDREPRREFGCAPGRESDRHPRREYAREPRPGHAPDSLDALLGQVRVGDPTSFRGLHLVPLFTPTQGEPEVLLLEEADRLEVQEVGQVGQLRVTNRARRSVLILNGEELLGGMQNRILNDTVLLHAGQARDLSVSCVEHGRWAFQGDFTPSGRVSSPRVRACNTRHRARETQPAGHQREVWQEVARELRRAGARSSTQAMAAGYDRHRNVAEELLRAVPLQEGQTGLVALVGSQVVALDLFGSSRLYARVHAKLLRSLALAALSPPGQAPRAGRRAAALAFVRSLQQPSATLTRRAGAGQGQELRLEAARAAGCALLEQERMICLSAFPC